MKDTHGEVASSTMELLAPHGGGGLVPQPGSSLNPLHLAITEALLHKHDWWTPHPVPFPSPEIRTSDWKFQPSMQTWFPWQPVPLLGCFPKVTSLISMQCDRNRLVVDNKTSASPILWSESGTEDERPNRVAPGDGGRPVSGAPKDSKIHRFSGPLNKKCHEYSEPSVSSD